MYIKGIHNTVADAISWLDYNPELNTTNDYTHATLGVEPEELSAQQWKLFAHHRQSYNKSSASTEAHCFHINDVLVHCSKVEKIHPVTTEEISEAQQADASLNHLFKRNAVIDEGLEIKLIKSTACVCKDGWLVIPKPLQVSAVKWYHHCLQHPGDTCLKEMMNTAMYWKGMRTTIRSITRSCRTCQINKRLFLNAPVEERIGGWNVDKMQYIKVEYIAVKTKYFIMSYNSGFCLVNVRSSAVYFANGPSQLFWGGILGKPKEEIRNLNGFEYTYLSGLDSLSAKSVLAGEKLIATYSIST
jgi:hypothetical protein